MCQLNMRNDLKLEFLWVNQPHRKCARKKWNFSCRKVCLPIQLATILMSLTRLNFFSHQKFPRDGMYFSCKNFTPLWLLMYNWHFVTITHFVGQFFIFLIFFTDIKIDQNYPNNILYGYFVVENVLNFDVVNNSMNRMFFNHLTQSLFITLLCKFIKMYNLTK